MYRKPGITLYLFLRYDEAYEDMYGASDRLQYGDCFSANFETNVSRPTSANIAVTPVDTDVADNDTSSDTLRVVPRTSTLDDRINQALRETGKCVCVWVWTWA